MFIQLAFIIQIWFWDPKSQKILREVYRCLRNIGIVDITISPHYKGEQDCGCPFILMMPPPNPQRRAGGKILSLGFHKDFRLQT